MSVKNISSAILGVGVDDTTIDLFESQYPVPTGVSYNSYVIRDEKTAILDTVDARATDEWMANVTEALAGEKPAYLVVHHMEPDHGANVARLAALYPEMQVVAAGLARPVGLLVELCHRAEAAKAVGGEEDFFGGLIAHHDLGPVDHGCEHESQGVSAQRKALAVLHDDAALLGDGPRSW